MDRLIGIETEYGIVVEGLSAADWVNESMAVVRGYAGDAVKGWNYRGEDARRDMRGFTVKSLNTNPDDAVFDTGGRHTLSHEEERSDRILANGARFYNDHGHPEYATPECRRLFDLVAHDRAGERVVHEAAKLRALSTGRQVTIYKNNTDFHGSSYGTHEGYLMQRGVDTATLIGSLLAFFASRTVFAGAGKAGVENASGSDADRFQLSQRADFMAVEASVDTLHNRPLVNTRDEPHATPSKYRRLHVICGDANMSEVATALKVGTTVLVLRLLEDGWVSPIKLRDPVRTARNISRDLSFRLAYEQDGGSSIRALDIQRAYLTAAEHRFAGADDETDWVLKEWRSVLDTLETDFLKLADRVDWVAKYALLDEFRQEEGLPWNDSHIQSLDLAYHNVDRDEGLYYGLEEAGVMRKLVTDSRVDAAVSCAPEDTRAYLRGLIIKRFGPAVKNTGWNGIVFHHNGEDLLFDMNPLVEANVKVLNDEFSSAETLDQVVELLRRSSQNN